MASRAVEYVIFSAASGMPWLYPNIENSSAAPHPTGYSEQVGDPQEEGSYVATEWVFSTAGPGGVYTLSYLIIHYSDGGPEDGWSPDPDNPPPPGSRPIPYPFPPLPTDPGGGGDPGGGDPENPFPPPVDPNPPPVAPDPPSPSPEPPEPPSPPAPPAPSEPGLPPSPPRPGDPGYVPPEDGSVPLYQLYDLILRVLRIQGLSAAEIGSAMEYALSQADFQGSVQRALTEQGLSSFEIYNAMQTALADQDVSGIRDAVLVTSENLRQSVETSGILQLNSLAVAQNAIVSGLDAVDTTVGAAILAIDEFKLQEQLNYIDQFQQLERHYVDGGFWSSLVLSSQVDRVVKAINGVAPSNSSPFGTNAFLEPSVTNDVEAAATSLLGRDDAGKQSFIGNWFGNFFKLKLPLSVGKSYSYSVSFGTQFIGASSLNCDFTSSGGVVDGVRAFMVCVVGACSVFAAVFIYRGTF